MINIKITPDILYTGLVSVTIVLLKRKYVRFLIQLKTSIKQCIIVY